MTSTNTPDVTKTPDVWLPFPADEVPGLPEGLNYRLWDGEPDYPADPADCAYYVVPYMKGAEVAVRPLAGIAGRPGRADTLRGHRPRRARTRPVAYRGAGLQRQGGP